MTDTERGRGDSASALTAWLAAHELDCREAVEQWMLYARAVPRWLVAALWEDVAWRGALQHAVVTTVAPERRTGVLRDVDAARGVCLEGLDAPSAWVAADQVAIPHPVSLAERDAWSSLLARRGVAQAISQLARETHARPAAGEQTRAITDFAGGKFKKRRHAEDRAIALGFLARHAGSATCQVWDGDAFCEARYWLGAGHPDEETHTGALSWVDARGHTVPLAAVGPVAFSEGMRMAKAIHAGCMFGHAAAPPAGGSRSLAVKEIARQEAVQHTEQVRAYRHADLPDRVVVALTTDDAADLERTLQRLGFSPGEPRGAAARGDRRPRRFPTWAPVHDPARPNGQVARREQDFMDLSLQFLLARQSEPTIEVFAKRMAERHSPRGAFARFRWLCVQRTLAGMPPWPAMARQLRRLAGAAELDELAEDASLLAELLASPAVAMAPADFWLAYEAPLIQLTAARPDLCGVLLNLFPTGEIPMHALDRAWIALLDKTRATDALVSDDAPAEVRPLGGRAAWFDRLMHHLSRRDTDDFSDLPFALLRRMAAMLIRDGAPIHGTARRGIDLDLVELALELGVPVEVPDRGRRLELPTWAHDARRPERGRDPVRTAAHPGFGVVLQRAVAQYSDVEAVHRVARGKHGMIAAARAWLTDELAHAERAGLPAIEQVLGAADTHLASEALAQLPELQARLAALDVAPALARTLRAGILDEFGWPALDAAVAELAADGSIVEVYGGPPAVVAASPRRAIAVGPTARLAEHDLVIPAGHTVLVLRFIGGEFFVLLRSPSHRFPAYWSRAPHDLFEVDNWYPMVALNDRATVLADGAWLESDAPIRPGDRMLAVSPCLQASDGTTSWCVQWRDLLERSWHEVDARGKPGAISWPPFIAPWVEPGWQIDNASYWLPAPGNVTASPLGCAHGFVGARVRSRYLPPPNLDEATEYELETIDGAVWRHVGGHRLDGLLQLPGGHARRPVAHDAGVGSAIFDATGAFVGSIIDDDRRYARGQPGALPPGFWHAMVARDPAGSQRLREVTDDDARTLMAAARALMAVPPRHRRTTAAPDASDGILALSSPLLRAGVHGLAELAVDLERRRDQLVAAHEQRDDAATE